MESKMTKYYGLELVLVLVGICFSIFVLRAVQKQESWAWPSVTILFALLTANLVFLFVQTQAFALFVTGLIISVVGLVMSVLSIPDKVDSNQSTIETYSGSGIETDFQAINSTEPKTEASTKRRGRPKKQELN